MQVFPFFRVKIICLGIIKPYIEIDNVVFFRSFFIERLTLSGRPISGKSLVVGHFPF